MKQPLLIQSFILEFLSFLFAREDQIYMEHAEQLFASRNVKEQQSIVIQGTCQRINQIK
jgi:hypothetical protein